MATALPILFGPQVCTSLDAGGQREWLVTGGLGGCAMGTVSGLRTRRYHGLLIAADGTPARRHAGLAALDPVLVLAGGARIRLGVHEWADGSVSPTGHRLLERFDLDDGDRRRTVPHRQLALEHDVDGLTGHLTEAGLGSVSETADGDAPHSATGCPFQAWSVAELLRARRKAFG